MFFFVIYLRSTTFSHSNFVLVEALFSVMMMEASQSVHHLKCNTRFANERMLHETKYENRHANVTGTR